MSCRELADRSLPYEPAGHFPQGELHFDAAHGIHRPGTILGKGSADRRLWGPRFVVLSWLRAADLQGGGRRYPDSSGKRYDRVWAARVETDSLNPEFAS